MATPQDSAPRGDMVTAEESWALRALHLAAGEADGALARRLRLRPLDMTAMIHVTSGRGSIGPKDLSGRLGITPAATTELVDRLERAGHVVREPDPADRRRIRLVPSPASIDRINDALEELTGSLDALAAEFSSAERATIRRYLEGARGAFDRFASSVDEGSLP